MFKRFGFALAPLLALFAAAPATAQEAPPRTDLVVLETEMGPIKVAIESERAPKTAANFLRYVDEKRFDGVAFYRAMSLDWGKQPNGLVQAGAQMDPKRILPPVAHEPTNVTGVKHREGTLSMARYEPGTATGDFSIMLSDDMNGLDANPAGETEDAKAGYAAFGHVVEGMEVVRAIFASPTDPEKGEGWMKGQMLAKPVKVLRARRVAGE
jgi:peptidyl-prolyl cis-trans isomerase A (cyclophilin A)